MAALVLAAILLPAPMFAQSARDSIISIAVNRNVRLPGDRVTFYVTVEGTAETPADAVARADTKTRSVLEALKRVGNQLEVGAPIPYGVSPVVSTSYPSPATAGSYVARVAVRLRLSKPEELSTISASALAAGAGQASATQFELSTVEQVRRQQIAEAMKAAALDAEATAAALGGRLGALIDLNVGSFNQFPQAMPLTFDNRFSQGTLVPDVNVSLNVTVRYRLQR